MKYSTYSLRGISNQLVVILMLVCLILPNVFANSSQEIGSTTSNQPKISRKSLSENSKNPGVKIGRPTRLSIRSNELPDLLTNFSDLQTQRLSAESHRSNLNSAVLIKLPSHSLGNSITGISADSAEIQIKIFGHFSKKNISQKVLLYLAENQANRLTISEMLRATNSRILLTGRLKRLSPARFRESGIGDISDRWIKLRSNSQRSLQRLIRGQPNSVRV
jgi:hypothetical protein